MLRFIALLALAMSASDLAAQDARLREGSEQRGSLATGDTAGYVLESRGGDYVSGSVEQISVDVVVRLVDPNGRLIRSIDGPARGGEYFQFETDQAGEYRIEVAPFEGEVGDFAITIDRLEPIETDPDKLVDQLMSAYDRDDSPGAAVAVFRDGRTLFSKSYGMANLAYAIPFEVDTRTNIGSTSKQFTAFAIMLLAERGQLSLDDDIRIHVPEVPDFGETITIRHILNHTSGLREFLNLLAMTGRRLDHGDYIDRAELIDIVERQPALQNSPGAEWNYNNTAFGLAALIVERISEQPFEEFMEENVFSPLEMTRSMVRPSPEHIVEERSEGYIPAGDGTYREGGDLAGAVGAGSIYTTVGDLQKWVENFWETEVGSPEIFAEMMEPFTLTDGESSGYGLGFFIDEQGGLERVHHGGADVAHRSMLAYYPGIRAGITTQSNHSNFDSNVTFRLAEAFFADAMELENEAVDADATFDPASFDPEDFDPFVGRYALDAAPTFILTFSREGSTLHAVATGQPQMEILPTSDSTFAVVGVEASLLFHRTADGEIEGVTLNQGGEQHATRLADDGEEAWAPTTEDLEDFKGRFFSVEIETFYDLVIEDDQLMLRHRRLDDAELTPGEKDTFAGGGLTFSFERDRNDRVIGFYISNQRTRDVRFARVN
jgi:CubicO group peptidase (beta-lactamase class C family)